MEFHEIANIFPLMEGEELSALAADIQAHGLVEPILTWQGKILDGRNRYRACAIAKVMPAYKEWSNGDPLAYIVSTNLHRRHLSTSQRQMIAAKLAEGGMFSGDSLTNSIGTEGCPNLDIGQRGAAELMNVSKSGVYDAAQILKAGDEEIIKAVEQGKMTVNAARAAVAPTKQQQPGYKRSNRRRAGKQGPRTNSPQKARLIINAARYAVLRDALQALGGMPDAREVAQGVGNGTEVIDRVLPHASRWLAEFNQAWSAKHGQSDPNG